MNWLKKFFIPHRGNSFRPHILREIGALGLFAVAVLFFVVAVSGRIIITRTDLTAIVLPRVLVDAANNDRMQENFSGLKINPVLEKAAQMKANDMAEKGYFAHKSPDGHSPWYWFQKAGYDFTYAGENLAVNFDDSDEVNKAWMNSPGHRANIMNGNFTEIGIATAEGTYQGRKTVYVVQLFGRPADKVQPAKLVKPAISNVKRAEAGQVANTGSEKVLSESASAGEFGDLYVEVEKVSQDQATGTVPKQSNFLERFIMSPTKFLSISYMIIGMILGLGFTIAVIVEIRKKSYRYAFISVFLLVVLFALLYIYKSFLFAPLLVV